MTVVAGTLVPVAFSVNTGIPSSMVLEKGPPTPAPRVRKQLLRPWQARVGVILITMML